MSVEVVLQGLVSGLLMGFVYALIAELALRMAHRACILESGRTILEGPSADLLASSEVKRIFLGH